MDTQHLVEEIRHVSLSMFRKNFLGVYHGSISARVDAESFLINKRNAIFDEMTSESLIRIESHRPDYRQSIASIDTPIHEEIYGQIPQAKYIAYAMPPYATAYTLTHDAFVPEDYFGYQLGGEMQVIDPGQFEDWYARAPHEIAGYFHTHAGHIMLIRGYGIYVHDRDLVEMARRIAILENSARLLMLSH